LKRHRKGHKKQKRNLLACDPPALLERDVHAWTLQMSTRGHLHKWTFVKKFEMPMQMDLTNVHAWTAPRSTRGHGRKSPVWIPKSKTDFFCFVEKSVEVEGFEPQSFAWKSSA
jgi:hypothetical protein